MFQAIEALDSSHQCMEYWNRKEVLPVSLGSADGVCKFAKGSSNSLGDVNAKVFGNNLFKQNLENPMGGSCHSFEEMKSILRGLLRKANPEELSTLHKLFSSDTPSAEWRVAFISLIEEMQRTL